LPPLPDAPATGSAAPSGALDAKVRSWLASKEQPAASAAIRQEPGMATRADKELSVFMEALGAASGYWKDRDVTQKSNEPAVVSELAWNSIFAVLGAPAKAVPVLSQHLVLKVVQGMVWVAVVILAQ
jgi:hypothetical protein